MKRERDINMGKWKRGIENKEKEMDEEREINMGKLKERKKE